MSLQDLDLTLSEENLKRASFYMDIQLRSVANKNLRVTLMRMEDYTCMASSLVGKMIITPVPFRGAK